MNSSLDGLGNAILTASVQLSNAWLAEFVRQNYIFIITFIIFLSIIWFIGLVIKNWIWKIEKISDSLEKIALSLDFLAINADQNNKSQEKNETAYIKKSVEEVGNQEFNK